jgi:glycosyltransferase 2 family protein
MRIVSIVTAIVGLLLGTAIVGYYGFGAVGSALIAIGWAGFFAVLLYHLALIVLLGMAWHAVLPPPRATPPWVAVWSRTIRDSGSEILPLSQIGGIVMGARAAIVAGMTAQLSLASTVVDVTLETLAQLVYALLGLGLLLWLHPNAAVARPIAIGLGVGVVAVFAFIMLQRRGMGLIEKMAEKLAPRWVPADAGYKARVMHLELHAIYKHMVGPQLGFLLHVAAWIANGIEAWMALRFMGAPLSIPDVLTIESLLYALRSFAFFVPNAVGVQEGGYVMLGALFGLPPEVALALSLLKRARDLTIGVPALLAWQVAEGGRLWRRGHPVPSHEPVRSQE